MWSAVLPSDFMVMAEPVMKSGWSNGDALKISAAPCVSGVSLARIGAGVVGASGPCPAPGASPKVDAKLSPSFMAIALSRAFCQQSMSKSVRAYETQVSTMTENWDMCMRFQNYCLTSGESDHSFALY